MATNRATRATAPKTDLITTMEASQIMGVSRAHVATLLARGELRGRRIPGRGRGGVVWLCEREDAVGYATARSSKMAARTPVAPGSGAAPRPVRLTRRQLKGGTRVPTSVAAERLGLSTSSVRRLASQGVLRSVMHRPNRNAGRGRLMIDEASIAQLKAEREAAAARRQSQDGGRP